MFKRASIYFFSDSKMYLIHPISSLSMGGGVASPPYKWVDFNLPLEEIVKGLIDALNNSKFNLSKPKNWDESLKEYLNDIGLLKHSDLYKNVKHVSVLQKDEMLSFTPTKNHGIKGGFQNVGNLKLVVSINNELKDLTATLKEAFDKSE